MSFFENGRVYEPHHTDEHGHHLREVVRTGKAQPVFRGGSDGSESEEEDDKAFEAAVETLVASPSNAGALDVIDDQFSALANKPWEAEFGATIKDRRKVFETYAHKDGHDAFDDKNPAYYKLSPKDARVVFDPSKLDDIDISQERNYDDLRSEIVLRSLDIQMSSFCGRTVAVKFKQDWLNTTLYNGHKVACVLASEDGLPAKHEIAQCVINYNKRVQSEVYKHFADVDIKERIANDFETEEYTIEGSEKPPKQVWNCLVDSKSYNFMLEMHTGGKFEYDISKSPRGVFSNGQTYVLDIEAKYILSLFTAIRDLRRHIRTLDINDLAFVVIAVEPKRLHKGESLSLGSVKHTSLDSGDASVMNQLIAVHVDIKISYYRSKKSTKPQLKQSACKPEPVIKKRSLNSAAQIAALGI